MKMNEREVKMALRAERKVDEILAEVDEILATTDDCIRILEESNARYEREFRKPDPLPMRRSNLLYWVLIFATFAFLSGAVFQASRAGAQSPAVNVCVSKLTAGINPTYMSRPTATRKARAICNGLQRMAPSFFRAFTR
jgi:hypothetical protein